MPVVVTRPIGCPYSYTVQTYDFSTFNSFKKKDEGTCYTHIKDGQRKGYFINSINGGGEKMYTADQICNMIDFLEDNIFVKFGGCLFRQVIGIPMGTNCAR